MTSFEQELKEKKLEHFIKLKINMMRYFGIHTKIKLSKISKHSRKIDVSEQFFKYYQNEDKNRCIRVKKWTYHRCISAKYCIRAKNLKEHVNIKKNR